MLSTVEDLLAEEEQLQRTINLFRFDSTYFRSFLGVLSFSSSGPVSSSSGSSSR